MHDYFLIVVSEAFAALVSFDAAIVVSDAAFLAVDLILTRVQTFFLFTVLHTSFVFALVVAELVGAVKPMVRMRAATPAAAKRTGFRFVITLEP